VYDEGDPQARVGRKAVEFLPGQGQEEWVKSELMSAKKK
jgi:hypothetical protein